MEDFITEIYIKEPGLKQIPQDSIDFLKELTVFSVERYCLDIVGLAGVLGRFGVAYIVEVVGIEGLVECFGVVQV